jgi:RND family efflux transporter MFP subunit
VNRLIRFGAPVAVISAGIGIFALLHWSKPEPEKKEETPRPLTVFVDEVRRSDVSLMVSTGGEVRAKTGVDLTAQVAGRIISISPEFVEGGLVQPGQALVTIEDTDYQLALSQAEVRVAGAEVGLQQAHADADVARKQLRDASNASDLALRRPQVAEAEARLVAARADLQQAHLNLARTRISLPFTGRVTLKEVDVGQFVSPGTRLGYAFATDMVEVRLSLSDSQLASLGLPIGFIAAPGAGLPVTFSAVVAGRTQYWQGHLVRLDASIDPRTRMLFGIAQVESPYEDNVSQFGMPLAVGLFVNAEISGQRVQNANVIPREALRAGNKVYLVNGDGKLEIRDVTVIHSSTKQAVIADGVAVGEQVIVSSIRNPIEGMALEPMQYAFDESSIADRHRPRPAGG